MDVFSFVRPCYNDGMKNDAIDRVKLPKPPRKNTGTILFIIIGGAILVYAIGALVWEYYTYGQEMRQFEQEVVAGQQEGATPQQRQIAEGKDETEPPRQGLFAYVENMAEVMRVHGDGEEGMNMITCTGAWVPGEKTFDTRAVIFTRRVS